EQVKVQRDEATIIGQAHRTSIHGAAFGNTELIAALDMAPINTPGHVAPYVVATALAIAEEGSLSGESVLAAVATGLEITARVAGAMDSNRAVKNGQPHLSDVMGFATSIFGSTAAAAATRKLSADTTADALGIAAGTSPVNALRAWQMHTPNTSVKYSLGGGLTLSALNAAYLADLGHRGDALLLEDPEYGYPRFIGTARWDPATLTTCLGTEWRFPNGTHFKPYPHCRVTHAPFDAVIDIVATNRLKPEEIESLTVYGEAWTTGVPTYMNRVIERPYDSQFSFAHGLSVAAHLVPPGKDWQRKNVVYSDSVMDLMTRVKWQSHESWTAAIASDPSARPTRVEIVARGKTYIAERDYPKGSRSADPTTYMTTAELVEKFFHNAQDAISPHQAEVVVDSVLALEKIDNIRDFMASLRPNLG
ncbi:MAG: MmgE/PrpD family protein, partial [Hyphomicrobiales bacterium]